MKKNKNIKIVSVILILLLIFFCYTTIVHAAFNPDSYKPQDQTGGTVISNIANLVVGLVQLIGSGVSVISMIVIGIKYMLGSVEEKAEYKKIFFPYLMGSIMIFAISNIVKFVYDLAIKIG